MSIPPSLAIDFIPQEAQALTAAGKTLCIARKVNGWYTVIWSSGAIQPANLFSWTDETLQGWAIKGFKDGEQVAPKETIAVTKGKVLTFATDGKMSVANDPNPDKDRKNAIKIEANTGPLWTGLSNILVTTPPVPTPTPFYVGRYGTIKDSTSWLYPSSKVLVWIGDQTTKTGSMFSTASTVAEVDLANAAGVLAYVAGKWLAGSLNDGKVLPEQDWKNGALVPHTATPKVPVPI